MAMIVAMKMILLSGVMAINRPGPEITKKEELMHIAWHLTRMQDCCMGEHGK